MLPILTIKRNNRLYMNYNLYQSSIVKTVAIIIYFCASCRSVQHDIYDSRLSSVNILHIKDTTYNNYIITGKVKNDTIIILSHFYHANNKHFEKINLYQEYTLSLLSLFPIYTYKYRSGQIDHAFNYHGFEFFPWLFGNYQLFISPDLNGLFVTKN